MVKDNPQFKVNNDFIIWAPHPRTRFAKGNVLHLERFIGGRQYIDYSRVVEFGVPSIVLPPEVQPVVGPERFCLEWRCDALKVACVTHQALVNSCGVQFRSLAEAIRALSTYVDQVALENIIRIAHDASEARHRFWKEEAFPAKLPAAATSSDEALVQRIACALRPDAGESVVPISGTSSMADNVLNTHCNRIEAEQKAKDEAAQKAKEENMLKVKKEAEQKTMEEAVLKVKEQAAINTAIADGRVPLCLVDRAPFPAAWGPPSQPVAFGPTGSDPDYDRLTSAQRQEWDDDMGFCDNFAQSFFG